MNEKPKPYLTAALICEKVLEEKDGNLSVIRIADRLEFHVPPGLASDQTPVANLSGLVALKSGQSKGGPFKLRFDLIRPSGDRKTVSTIDAQLAEGEDQGANFIIQFGIRLEQEGLHWFDVFFDDELLTRIPLTLLLKADVQVQK